MVVLQQVWALKKIRLGWDLIVLKLSSYPLIVVSGKLKLRLSRQTMIAQDLVLIKTFQVVYVLILIYVLDTHFSFNRVVLLFWQRRGLELSLLWQL